MHDLEALIAGPGSMRGSTPRSGTFHVERLHDTLTVAAFNYANAVGR